MLLALSLGHFLFWLVQPSAEFVRVGSLSLQRGADFDFVRAILSVLSACWMLIDVF